MNRALTLVAVLAAIALPALALAACGGSDETSTAATSAATDGSTTAAGAGPYPEKVRDEFRKSCYASSGGKKSLCDCLIRAYEETMPLDDYLAIANPKPGKAVPTPPTETQDAANACADDYRQAHPNG